MRDPPTTNPCDPPPTHPPTHLNPPLPHHVVCRHKWDEAANEAANEDNNGLTGADFRNCFCNSIKDAPQNVKDVFNGVCRVVGWGRCGGEGAAADADSGAGVGAGMRGETGRGGVGSFN